MTVIVDYGVGNLFSLLSSFSAIGEQAVVSSEKSVVLNADRIVLPGVGAFSDAAFKLEKTGLKDAVLVAAKNGTPIMGVCLGMQLLFDKSYEFGEYKGLGLISGEVRPIAEFTGDSLKIPHIGWNKLRIKRKHPLLKYAGEDNYAYFVHSYCAVNCDESVVADTDYGTDITAVVAKGNVMGCQFHPEKSGTAGLKILKAFSELKKGDL
ncbi:MAG: imidazole glycerol phosphate synthase subunit HisH [Clostridia bacterium]|nr:imidazole glycerol phosphate synthase subunit HisH [Clostridia bacterium]